jgi:hypothetical protein
LRRNERADRRTTLRSSRHAERKTPALADRGHLPSPTQAKPQRVRGVKRRLRGVRKAPGSGNRRRRKVRRRHAVRGPILSDLPGGLMACSFRSASRPRTSSTRGP